MVGLSSGMDSKIFRAIGEGILNVPKVELVEEKTSQADQSFFRNSEIKRVYELWKKGQEDYIKLCREKIKRTKPNWNSFWLA